MTDRMKMSLLVIGGILLLVAAAYVAIGHAVEFHGSISGGHRVPIHMPAGHRLDGQALATALRALSPRLEAAGWTGCTVDSDLASRRHDHRLLTCTFHGRAVRTKAQVILRMGKGAVPIAVQSEREEWLADPLMWPWYQSRWLQNEAALVVLLDLVAEAIHADGFSTDAPAALPVSPARDPLP